MFLKCELYRAVFKKSTCQSHDKSYMATLPSQAAAIIHARKFAATGDKHYMTLVRTVISLSAKSKHPLDRQKMVDAMATRLTRESDDCIECIAAALTKEKWDFDIVQKVAELRTSD
jgi:hypothetical protein